MDAAVGACPCQCGARLHLGQRPGPLQLVQVTKMSLPRPQHRLPHHLRRPRPPHGEHLPSLHHLRRVTTS
jgi:hypothetical protein